jgi:asparagine synthase (glutamine-hydrolysing)
VSGIAGFWNRDGGPVDTRLLERMGAALAHRGPDAEGTAVNGSVGMVCRLARIVPESATEIQPVCDAAGAILVFDGRLDNREVLIEALQGDGPVSSDAPDSTLVLAAFRRYDEALPVHLLGDFALALFDPARQRLLLATDAIGLRPLHYHVGARSFVFASEIKAILADPDVPAVADEDVVADLLLNGLVAEDTQGMTCFRGILSVLPAHMVVVTRHGVTSRRYWDFDPGHQIRFRRFEDYVSAFGDHFRRAVQRRLRSVASVGVSVSGGVDSSSVYCQALMLQRSQSGLAPLIAATCTFPSGSPSDEQRFIETIEQQHGVRIARADLPGGITRRSYEGVWHVEAPALDPQWNRTSGFMSFVRNMGVRVLLTGHWGDQVLFDSAYLVELCRRGHWLTAWSQARGLSTWVGASDPTYFQRELLRSLARATIPGALVPGLRWLRRAFMAKPPIGSYSESFVRRARLAERRRPAWSTRFGPRARSVYAQVRSRYHVHCMEWNGKAAAMHGLEMAFPFLDRDLLTFQLATPSDIHERNGVPKVLLREAMSGIVPQSIAWRASKTDFTEVSNAGVARDYGRILESVGEGSCAARAGYLAVGTDRVAASQRPPVSGESAAISRGLVDLFSLELWLQAYFQRTNQTQPLQETV